MKHAQIYAISARLRPKLMTASAAIIALIPLAFGTGSGAQRYPSLAFAVIRGLIVALSLLSIVLQNLINLIIKNESIKVESNNE
jgi:heavy metal efflux system protein